MVLIITEVSHTGPHAARVPRPKVVGFIATRTTTNTASSPAAAEREKSQY